MTALPQHPLPGDSPHRAAPAARADHTGHGFGLPTLDANEMGEVVTTKALDNPTLNLPHEAPARRLALGLNGPTGEFVVGRSDPRIGPNDA